MANCELLARRVEEHGRDEVAAGIANEIREVGASAEKMLDAIVASVEQILAVEQAAAPAADCDALKRNGHTSDCARQAALGAAK